MHQGNWTCSGCNGSITQLPFEPKSTNGLLCRECHSKGKGAGGGGAPQGGERARFEGAWSCSGCSAAITSLPFTPRDTSNLLCIDCFKKKKGG